MKMRINQLDEEVDEKNSRIELLTKSVDKDQQSECTNRVPVGSQTKEVKIKESRKLRTCMYF